MSFKQLAITIGSFAPTLAAMLGGPLAGTAVAALEQALGLQSGAGPEAIKQVVEASALTPDQVVAIRAADQKHAEVIGQQGIDLEKINADHVQAFAKIDADDRANARSREVALRDWTPMILAFAITIGFFSVLGWMLHKGVPKDGGEALLVLLGSLGTAWTGICAYYYGSSAGSASKSDALNRIATTK